MACVERSGRDVRPDAIGPWRGLFNNHGAFGIVGGAMALSEQKGGHLSRVSHEPQRMEKTWKF
jgi:hypothetical protein